MGQLATFLFRSMKGLRGLIVLALLVTVLQVSCDIFAAFPLKFIPSKVQNTGNDPACLFPFLSPIESWFDIPQIDPSLQPDPRFAPGIPPEAQCPVDPNDPQGRIVTVQHSTIGVIVFSLLLLVIFGLLSALFAFLALYLAAHIGQQLTARLRNRLFDHLQRLSLDWHGKQKKGDLVQRITGNIADIEKLATDGLVDLLAGVLTLVAVVTVMLFLSPQYTLIAMAIAPALFLMVLGYTRNIKAAAKKAAKATGQVAHVATEDINALTLIKVFTREELEAVRFGSYVDKNKRAGLRAGWLQAQFTPLVTLLVIVGTAAVLGVGGYVGAGNDFTLGPFSIAADSVDIGTLILFLVFLKLLYQPMRDLSKLATLASTASSGAERIQEVLDQAPEVKDSPLPGPYRGPQRFRGEISFEHVVMGYLPGVPVLHDITLQISPGKKIALVGLSGGGKTTLVKLIPRFYEIEQGTITIDGVDNRLYPLDVLRNNVSMVLQDSVLFEGTIRENIALGRPGAGLEDIIEAAKKAQMHETITGLPEGYETWVSEQGKNFSGGQRQRLAIARAILRDAPILILDEPTAALDVEAEAEVMRALDALVVGRTVIVISHRLSTLGNVDEIIVLSAGRIVERGTYRELKRLGGAFTHMLEEQNRYSAEKAGDKSILRSAFLSPPVGDEQWPVRPAAPAAPQQWSAPSPPVSSPVAQQGWAPAQPQRPAPVPVAGGPPRANGDGNRPSPSRARVRIELDGKIIGERLLDKPMLTIGRLTGNDIQVPSQRVSRLHARMRWENGTWLIEDADSLNGIVYQGTRIERLALNNGDRVYLAPTAVLHYHAR
jgi:ATP-binding cassette, subfamily B, bacterial